MAGDVGREDAAGLDGWVVGGKRLDFEDVQCRTDDFVFFQPGGQCNRVDQEPRAVLTTAAVCLSFANPCGVEYPLVLRGMQVHRKEVRFGEQSVDADGLAFEINRVTPAGS